ncbi:hypothetical protein KEM54_004855 [Ascosphaera aggregata]|nr:hypothetical protein KEM54_004855 [Ascosphaera aggregata]
MQLKAFAMDLTKWTRHHTTVVLNPSDYYWWTWVHSVVGSVPIWQRRDLWKGSQMRTFTSDNIIERNDMFKLQELILLYPCVSDIALLEQESYALSRIDVCTTSIGGDLAPLVQGCDSHTPMPPENFLQPICGLFAGPLSHTIQQSQALSDHESLGNVKKWDSVCHSEDTQKLSFKVADTSIQQRQGYCQELTVDNGLRFQDAGQQSSSPSATMTDQFQSSSSSSPFSTSYVSQPVRPMRHRAMTIPLLAQKADNITRLERPSLGPRSPRCDGFGTISQPASLNVNPNPCSSQGDIKASALNWKDKVGHILAFKKSSSHIRNEAPTVLSLPSSDNKWGSISGPPAVPIASLWPKDHKGETIHRTCKFFADAIVSNRPLSYDRGVAFLHGHERLTTVEDLSVREGAPLIRPDSNITANCNSKEDNQLQIFNKEDDAVGTAVTVNCLDDENKDRDSIIQTVRMPDGPSRLVIHPRSSSKQPTKGDGDPLYCGEPHGTWSQRHYRTGSTETIRIYNGSSSSTDDKITERNAFPLIDPTLHASDPFSIESIVDDEVYGLRNENHNFETVPEDSPIPAALADRQAHAGEKKGKAGLALSSNIGVWSRVNNGALKQPEPSVTVGQPIKKSDTAPTEMAAPSDKVTINFSRKESLNQIRAATRKIVRQRQQGLATNRASMGHTPPVNQNIRIVNHGNISPRGQQKKGSSLPVPTRGLYGGDCSYRSEADSGKATQAYLPSVQQSCQKDRIIPSEKMSMALTEKHPVRHPDANSYGTASLTAALTNDDGIINSKEETARSLLLSDGYTLKQLSDHSPNHGPQLRVAPDAAKLLIGSPAENGRRTHRTRFPFQDFRMSEPLFTIRSMGAIPANTSCRLSKPRVMTLSQSATCLTSGSDSQRTKKADADTRIKNTLKTAPVLASGQSESSLLQRLKSIPPTPGVNGTSMGRFTGQTPQCASYKMKQDKADTSIEEYPSATTFSDPFSPCSQKAPQLAPVRNPRAEVDGTKNHGHSTPAPIREVPSSSSLQSRFHSQLRTTIPLPRNMVQTKYSGEGLTKDFKTLPKSSAQVRPELANRSSIRNDEPSMALQDSKPQSQSIARAETRFGRRLNEGSDQQECGRDVNHLNQDHKSSKLERKSSRASRNMFSNIRGLFLSKNNHEAADSCDVKTTMQPAIRQRAKLVRKETRTLQKQEDSQEEEHQHERQHCRYRDCVRNVVEAKTTAISRQRMMNKRVLSPRVVPWPPPVVGEGSFSKPDKVTQGVSQSNQRLDDGISKTRCDFVREEVGKDYNSAQPTDAGAQNSKVKHSVSAQSTSDCVRSDPGHLSRVSRVSNLTEYTMELLKAARREGDDATKVKMIRLAKTLVEAVNHAHEAEKSMLIAAQAARRAELSCAQAQENALKIGDIAREAMRFVQGAGNNSVGAI